MYRKIYMCEYSYVYGCSYAYGDGLPTLCIKSLDYILRVSFDSRN